MEEQNYIFAILDSQNNVINLILLDKDDDEWGNFFAAELGASKAISCKKFGQAEIGGKWNGEFFVDKDGKKVPFVPKPFDKQYLYEYNEELKEWVNIGPDILFQLGIKP